MWDKGRKLKKALLGRYKKSKYQTRHPFSTSTALNPHSQWKNYETMQWRKAVTNSNSQLLKSWRNCSSQPLLSPTTCLTNKDSTEAARSIALSYKTGKAYLRGWSPHQQSSIPIKKKLQNPKKVLNLLMCLITQYIASIAMFLSNSLCSSTPNFPWVQSESDQF